MNSRLKGMVPRGVCSSSDVEWRAFKLRLRRKIKGRYLRLVDLGHVCREGQGVSTAHSSWCREIWTETTERTKGKGSCTFLAWPEKRGEQCLVNCTATMRARPPNKGTFLVIALRVLSASLPRDTYQILRIPR